MKYFIPPSSSRPPPTQAPTLSELFATLFTADPLIPEDPRSMAEWSGCHRLLYAILAEAVHTYQMGIRHPRSVHLTRYGHEAADWINDSTMHDVCSAETICEVLHLDLSSLRAGLAAWTIREEAGLNTGPSARMLRPHFGHVKAGRAMGGSQ
jgi:hypothetical protein